jgi:spermidine synthase
MNIEIIRKEVEVYKDQLQRMDGRSERSSQADSILKVLEQHLKTEGPINIIETGASHNWDDGMMGLLFARISQHTGGKMWMVDIDKDIIEHSKEVFKNEGITCVEFIVGDSVKFLEDFNERVDIVHLDSWDLNLFDPFPSALHGWREFISIKDKLSNESIVIVDDNYLSGTWVDWNHTINGQIVRTEKITINYPCVGKGSHIWWWVQQPENGWELLSENIAGQNVKVICKKT